MATAEVEKRIWQWRHLMEYFLIKRYQACIDALQGGSDAVGAPLRACRLRVRLEAWSLDQGFGYRRDVDQAQILGLAAGH